MLLIKNALVLNLSAAAQNELASLGYVLIDPPDIKQVGTGTPPASIQQMEGLATIDAGGGWLLPGLIDAHCHIGLYNDGLAGEGEDGNEMTDPISPQLQAIDAIFQDDRCFRDALSAGVTTVMTGPGSANVLAGRFALLRTCGRTTEEMTIQAHAAMKAAFGENPKRVYGRKDKTPSTRMATAALLRDALTRARSYGQAQGDGGSLAIPPAAGTNREIDLRWEALLPVLRGDMPLKIHAHRTDDILTGIRIANEFGLRYTLEHCTEGYLIVDVLASEYEAGLQAGRGVGQPGLGKLEGLIVGPLMCSRSKPELNRESDANPAILANAGLPLAIMTDHPELPIQFLPVSAAMAVRGGMREDQALAAITIHAARLCGAAERLGSIESGKQADLALFSGHPFDYRSKVRKVFSRGIPVWPEPGA